MNFPCPNKVDCPGSDFPIANISTEEPDHPIFPCVWTYSTDITITGSSTLEPWCTKTAESSTSDADACHDAFMQAWQCVQGSLVCNDELTIRVPCP